MRVKVLRRCVWVMALLMLASCTAGMPAYAGSVGVHHLVWGPAVAVAACQAQGTLVWAPGQGRVTEAASGPTCRASRPRKRSPLRRAPMRRTPRRATGDGSCDSMRTQRAAAYEEAGLKRDFALSSYWDNKVHQACR